MNRGMITLGCIMAESSEHESGEITSASEDAKLTFCHTTNSETDMLIVTPQMRQLAEAGYLPIAIAKVQRDDVTQFRIFAVNGLSQNLRAALELQGCDVVRGALSRSPGGQDVFTTSD